MDIVSRIKEFLSINGISNSVFADNCEIPRPTLSQLLNGRNKKISNEILDKIHYAYPELSMMWLIFGEGEMNEGIGKNETNEQAALFAENAELDDENFSDEEDGNLDDCTSTMAEVIQSLSKKTEIKKSGVGNAKRIISIMVFYSDNSFESFVSDK